MTCEYPRCTCMYSLSRCTCMYLIGIVQRFEPQGRRFINFLYYYYYYYYYYCHYPAYCSCSDFCFISFFSLYFTLIPKQKHPIEVNVWESKHGRLNMFCLLQMVSVIIIIIMIIQEIYKALTLWLKALNNTD